MITGSSYSTLLSTFRIGKSTACGIIKDTTRAIWDNMNSIHMGQLTEKHFYKVAADLKKKKTGFPHCIGIIDGKHVRIKASNNSHYKYYNFKKFHSVVLQAVVDCNYKYLSIDVGAPGRQHDSRTLQNSNFYLPIPKDMPLPRSNTKVPFVFLADGAYAISRHIMKPFRGVNLTSDKKLFNRKLSSARSRVERVFGQMAQQFSIFHQPMQQSVEVVIDIIKCACLLHNIILDKCKLHHFYATETEEALNFVDLEQSTNDDRESNGYSVRDKFVTFFLENQ